MRAWVALVIAGCGFSGTGSGDDVGGRGDGPGASDGRIVDAKPSPDGAPDGMIDAEPACPTALPGGCTGMAFECGGSAGACYALCVAPTRTHGAAEGVCMDWGGHLASLNDTAERNCIDSIMDAQDPGDVWFGARQAGGNAPDESWSNLDGTTFSFAGWASDQPDDLDNSENGEENCGSLESSASYLPNDDACAQLQTFVCERPRA